MARQQSFRISGRAWLVCFLVELANMPNTEASMDACTYSLQDAAMVVACLFFATFVPGREARCGVAWQLLQAECWTE